MNEALKLLLSLSLSGSIIAALMFALKPFVKEKLSKSIQYYIWIIVLLRLILPFSFEVSIMNRLFNSNQNLVITSIQNEIKSVGGSNSAIVNPYPLSGSKDNVTAGEYSEDVDHSRYFRDIINHYSLLLWIAGVIVVLAINLIGYIRFLKCLKKENKLATEEERRILVALLDGRKNVKLVRNRLINTPMLIGILRPCIIIPDIDYDESQLRYILLHEITHLKRFDIAVKWLIMIATSIHWFNPLMYFIKKEINHACELACDESVINDLNSAEKQAYGDTLIYIVAKHKYPVGVLQATMCEDKKSLKERLVAIMNHNKKSKIITISSVVILIIVITGALALGASNGNAYKIDKTKVAQATKQTSPDTSLMELGYDLKGISKYKTAYIGDNSKVSAIASRLPVPDKYFRQRYISMITDKKPYSLTIYYEAASDSEYKNTWPIASPDSVIEGNSRMNALVVFCMIDNLDEVTFAFRNSQSDGKLDESKYDTSFTFTRASFEEEYGELSALASDLGKLQSILANNDHESAKDTTMESSLHEFTDAEVAVARSVVEEYFRAIAAKDDGAILKTLTPIHNQPNAVLYGEETRKLLSIDYDASDSMRESYVKYGRGSVNGTKIENVIVFKVNFNIKYPKGVSGSFNEGDYTNWSMILIRDDNSSPWLIDDQGY